MADNLIPKAQRKPGRMSGGVWVVLQSWSVANQWVIALLGETGAVVSAGYGDWMVTPIPRDKGMTEWRGENQMEMALDLMFDGWLAHPIIPSLRKSFHTPPKLPTGIKFQNRASGKPVGATVKSSVRRPLPPPPSRPGHLKHSQSAVFGKKGGVHARALGAPQPRHPAPVNRRGSAKPQAVWMEANIKRLESLALRQPGDDAPRALRIYGPVPHANRRWVIQSMEWGDAIRDQHTGRRIRQQVTVHLVEFHHPQDLVTLPRGRASKDGKTKKRNRAQPVQVPRSS